jgi:hypothetical protein
VTEEASGACTVRVCGWFSDTDLLLALVKEGAVESLAPPPPPPQPIMSSVVLTVSILLTFKFIEIL